MKELDIRSNRNALKYSQSEIIKRILWSVGIIFFRLTPRTFFATRNLILKIFGATIGKEVQIYSSAHIYFPWNLKIGSWSSIGENALIYNLGFVDIGEKSTISHGAHLCAGTHDYTNVSLPLQKPRIFIENQVWVASDAFIGPGVTIGNGAVVGARAAVFQNVDPWTVVGGNPAKFIKKRIIKDLP